jgi:hypothetical protein
MSKNIKLTDGLVAESDFILLRKSINRGELQRLVLELWEREPEIAVGVSEQFDFVLKLLSTVSMTAQHRAKVINHLSILTWSSALVIESAHRRAWEDFLPSIETTKPTGGGFKSEGGAK